MKCVSRTIAIGIYIYCVPVIYDMLVNIFMVCICAFFHRITQNVLSVRSWRMAGIFHH
jgi:hypothetical protein